MKTLILFTSILIIQTSYAFTPEFVCFDDPKEPTVLVEVDSTTESFRFQSKSLMELTPETEFSNQVDDSENLIAQMWTNSQGIFKQGLIENLFVMLYIGEGAPKAEYHRYLDGELDQKIHLNCTQVSLSQQTDLLEKSKH